jgi:hypothetical protein
MNLLVLLAFLASPGIASGADSTSFNPVPVVVKAQGSGVPVGTVVAWPASSNPEDSEPAQRIAPGLWERFKGMRQEE